MSKVRELAARFLGKLGISCGILQTCPRGIVLRTMISLHA
jgi:hypothetical protein